MTTPPADVDAARARLAKHEAWIGELEARQARLAASKRTYLRAFAVLVAVSPLGFLVHPWIGAASVFTGLIMCLFGFYMVLGRGAEYVRVLDQAQRDAETLRGELDANRQPR